MNMSAFAFGPFTFEPGSALRVAGATYQQWEMRYGLSVIASRTLTNDANQSTVIEAFADDRAAFNAVQHEQYATACIELVDQETGVAVGSFHSDSSCGMTPGLIDDRSRYWIRSAYKRYSRPVTLSQFAALAAAHSAPANVWIAGLLSGEVLADDPDDWRSPSAWEIRHVVGAGSFTGISGARAAAMVGVTPQNFRKYTAADGARTRQKMAFAMWHLLLHKLGVKRA